MNFVAGLLTMRFSSSHHALAFADHQQLRQDVLSALFPGEEGVLPLLTVALLHSDRQQALIRLTVAEERQGIAISQLLRRIQAGQPLQLCSRTCEIDSFDLSNSAWTGLSTWADLQTNQRCSYIPLSFVTPLLTFSRRNSLSSDALPFPEPLTLFTAAMEQWRNLAGPPLPCSAQHLVQATRCVLADCRLRTVKILSPSSCRIGYLGWASYECLAPQAKEIAFLHGLMRLLFFTGCGYETAYGFGVTRRVSRKRGI